VFLQSMYKFYYVMARSRYRFDRSREFFPGYKFGSGHWRSEALQTISKAVISHGTRFKLLADAGIRVPNHYKLVLGAGAKAKTVTNNLPILSVLAFRGMFNQSHCPLLKIYKL
jgi:hypothetical protein